MKYIFPILLSLFLFSCGGPSSKSLEIENKTMNCWSDCWSPKNKYQIAEGVQLLDDYLFSKGYLGKREIADYKKYIDDTFEIVIPSSVAGTDKMQIALGGESAGAPDLGCMAKCWEENWFSKMKVLDSTDVILRIGKLMKALSEAGAPDAYAIKEDFFKNLTIEEFNRPLVKTMFYILFSIGRDAHHPHLRFEHPDDSFGPPPPPSPPPPPPPVPSLSRDTSGK